MVRRLARRLAVRRSGRAVRGMVPLAVRRLDELGVDVEDVRVRHSTLDDVFFALTGRALDPDDDIVADVAVAS